MERSGTRILTMAANSINRHILRELSDGPLQMDVGGVEAKITPQGEELLFIAFVLERWLQNAPEEPLPFGSVQAKAAITSVVDGWGTTMVHAFSLKPMTLTELEQAIGVLSRSSLRRRLGRMVDVGLLETRPPGEGGLYVVTDWMREAIAPLAAAARWERRNAADDTAPIAHLDVEAAFMLTLPLLELSSDLSGTCLMAARIPDDEERPLAGAMVGVEGGRVASCDVCLEGEAEASTIGEAPAWLDAVIEGDPDGIEVKGDERLARALLDGLHETLFGVPVQPEA